MTLTLSRKIGAIKEITEEDEDVIAVGATIFVHRELTEGEKSEIRENLDPQHIAVIEDGSEPETRIDL